MATGDGGDRIKHEAPAARKAGASALVMTCATKVLRQNRRWSFGKNVGPQGIRACDPSLSSGLPSTNLGKRQAVESPLEEDETDEPRDDKSERRARNATR